MKMIPTDEKDLIKHYGQPNESVRKSWDNPNVFCPIDCKEKSKRRCKECLKKELVKSKALF